MESSSSSRRPAAPASQAILMATSSGEWMQILVEILGMEKRAAMAASLARREREVVIDFGSSERDNSALEAITEEADSALHVVAAAGDSERYQKCARVVYGVDSHLLAARNGNGDTPLHCAARVGNTMMVACLLELAEGEGGVGDDEKVRALLSARNKRGETALHEAVRFAHDVKMIGALMDKDKLLANKDKLARVVADDGTSPLYLAISLGRHEIALKLHKEDHELSYSGPDGQNALHIAAVLRDKVMTRLLLEWNKALVKQRDTKGSTPLHFAASAPDPCVQVTLFAFGNYHGYSFGSTFWPRHLSAALYERMRFPLTQLLCADPSPVFQPDVYGSLPVHVAASAGSIVSIVVLLTRHPGCAGLRDAQGRTFLHIAVEKKRFRVVKFICAWWRCGLFKSVVNIQDNNGNTALHLAILEGEMDMSRWLIGNHYVLINLQNKKGNTPMDIATGKVQSGFFFGLTAPRRILSMLTAANALPTNHRRDQMEEYNGRRLPEKEESKKITDFAQIVGIGSVLVATATFTALFTMPGGNRPPNDMGNAAAPPPPPGAPAGTPVLAGSYAFDGFVISNTLAFICSTLATFSLVYCGVAAADIRTRINLVSFSLALLLCAARSFCAAFAFSLYLLLAKVAHGTAIASIVMTSFALLDGLWFLLVTLKDTTAILSRRKGATLAKLGAGFLFNIIYFFWPYLVIFGYMLAHLYRRSTSPSHA